MTYNPLENSINSLTNAVKNPFSTDTTQPKDKGNDFKDGFVIEELQGPKEIIKFIGNMLPHRPFNFGGTQRIKKAFYAGHSEPTMQVLGPQENNTEISGEFKDIRYKGVDRSVSLEIQQLVDGIRIRGNLCRFQLGTWRRYGFIETSDFNMNRENRIKYKLSISIAGFNPPTNAKFVDRSKDIPIKSSKELQALIDTYQAGFGEAPPSVPTSIADKINGFVSDIAESINVLTNFVDETITTVEDVKSSIERAKGMIKYNKNKVRSYTEYLGGVDHYDAALPLDDQYSNASFYLASSNENNVVTTQLNKFQAQFDAIAQDLPKARHLVRQEDTLQTISVKFYDTSGQWKDIYEYNKLTSTALEVGSILEIPRV